MELHDTRFEGIIISMVFVIRIVQDISTKRAILLVFSSHIYHKSLQLVHSF